MSADLAGGTARGPNHEPSPPLTVHALGEQVRGLRKERGLTLAELGEMADVSPGLLSQLERGQGNPSFNTLVQVAHALSVPVARLFSSEPSRSPVVRRGERRQLAVHTNGAEQSGLISVELLTPGLDHALEVLELTMQPGYSSEDAPLVHEGEEFGLILEGRHEVFLGGTCYVLEAGDSITYPSTIPHWYRNPTDEVVRALWIITPPTF